MVRGENISPFFICAVLENTHIPFMTPPSDITSDGQGEGVGREATQAKVSPRDTNTPGNGVKLPACNGTNRFWHSVSELVSSARFPEEPGAVVPHAGICEGGVGQPTSLPQCAKEFSS